jgi:hypothetical protein
MPVPPIPPPIEHMGQRPFSFYPPILNIEHNEWVYRRSTWSEVLVVNTKTNSEIFVPRRYIGELSRIDEPTMIVGLVKELEYKSGQVWPHERRVIEMPRAVNDSYRAAIPYEPAPAPAPVVGIRLETSTESRIGRLIVAVLVLGVVGCVLLVGFFRGARDGSHVIYNTVLQTDLGLIASDDYYAVERRLGKPASDRWRSEEGEMQIRVLGYPDQGISVILMGSDRDKAHYIGALDKDWRPVDAVSLPGGKNTKSLLKSIPRF